MRLTHQVGGGSRPPRPPADPGRGTVLYVCTAERSAVDAGKLRRYVLTPQGKLLPPVATDEDAGGEIIGFGGRPTGGALLPSRRRVVISANAGLISVRLDGRGRFAGAAEAYGAGPVPAAPTPSPGGDRLYVLNTGSPTAGRPESAPPDSVGQFRTDADGRLARLGAGWVRTGRLPDSMVAHWKRRVMYVAAREGVVYAHRILGSGALGPAWVLARGLPAETGDLALSPGGSFLYSVTSAQGGRNVLSRVPLGPDGKASGPVQTETVPTGGRAYTLSVAPNGRHAYVSTVLGPGILRYQVDARGRLVAPRPADERGLFQTRPSPLWFARGGAFALAAEVGDDEDGSSALNAYRVGPAGDLTLTDRVTGLSGEPVWVGTVADRAAGKGLG